MSPAMQPRTNTHSEGPAVRPVYNSSESNRLLPSAKLSELLQEVAPGEKLDLDVEEFMQEHAEQFVDSVTEFACRLAKHRKSRTLDARDVQLHLEKNWDIRVPGYGDDPRPARRATPTPIHQARLNAINRSQHGLV